jgi:hypothetical protein
MFNFRIINLADGNQIIDSSLKTSYNSLTAVQMQEYIEVDCQLGLMERQKRKEQREAAEHKRRLWRNPFYHLACMFGIAG